MQALTVGEVQVSALTPGISLFQFRYEPGDVEGRGAGEELVRISKLKFE